MDILVTVKAYPALSKRHGETVCVAGIRPRADGTTTWARLWPVPFRDLEWSRQFSLWQFVKVEATPSAKDDRPESFMPNSGSIESGAKLDTDRGTWARRLEYLEPLMAESMCEVIRRQARDGTSLGAFRPAEILDVQVEDNTPWTTLQQSMSMQGSLFDQERAPLEWIPKRFKYRYRCGEGTCRGHSQSVIDWGLHELWRKLARAEGESAATDKTADKLRSIAGADKDTILIAGNMHRYPDRFLVIGMAYPKKKG